MSRANLYNFLTLRCAVKRISCKKVLDDRINMLIQNEKITESINRKTNSFRIADNAFNSSITDALHMTQRSPLFLSTPSFSASPDQSPSNTSFKQRCSLI